MLLGADAADAAVCNHAQGLRVYEQGKVLAAWQDQLSDAVQAQLQAMFEALCSHFLGLASAKVCWLRQPHHLACCPSARCASLFAPEPCCCWCLLSAVSVMHTG
jgi:hypothetical protein